jgi:MFS family permease
MEYRLLARSPFLAANIYNFFFGAVTMGFYSFIPYYAVVTLGLTPFQSAAVLTPRALLVVFTSTAASLLMKRLGYRMPMLVGMLLVALTLFLLAQGWTGLQLGPWTIDGFWLLAAIISIGGLGMGLANPASSNAAIDQAPDKAASISGIRGTFRLAGGTISISCVVLTLSFFPDQARGLDLIFLVFTGILLVTVPLVLMIPEAVPSPKPAPIRRQDAPVPASAPLKGTVVIGSSAPRGRGR